MHKPCINCEVYCYLLTLLEEKSKMIKKQQLIIAELKQLKIDFRKN